MICVPPRIRRPINRRAVATGGATFEPEFSLAVFPDANGMAIEFFLAMKTPLLLIEVRPLATDAVRAKQI